MIVGGVDLLAKAEEQERLLEESNQELEERRQRAEKLRRELEEKEVRGERFWAGIRIRTGINKNSQTRHSITREKYYLD